MVDQRRVWHGCSPDTYVHRHWPDESEHLVFVLTSGHLHLMTATAIRVLEALDERPVTVEELAARAEIPHDAASDVLSSLERIGLATGHP